MRVPGRIYFGTFFCITAIFSVLSITACPTAPAGTTDPTANQPVVTNTVTNTYTNAVTQTVTNVLNITNQLTLTNITTNYYTNFITNIITNITIVPLHISISSAAVSGADLTLTLSLSGPADWVDVRVNGLTAAILSNNLTNATVDIKSFSAMTFELSVIAGNAYTNSAPDSRWMNGIYVAKQASTVPTIDGNPGDACWSTVTWASIDQLWLDFGSFGYPAAADFTGRAKMVWKGNVLYVLGEVIDDVINDAHANWDDNYWEDDTFEIFIDEDNSGGDHELNENAYAYHCSILGDAVDINSSGTVLYNSHVSFARQATGTTNYWEFAVTVYNSSLNPIGAMAVGKIMGLTMAYCDNDGGSNRQIFMGMNIIDQADKNVAYKNADFFGHIILQ